MWRGRIGAHLIVGQRRRYVGRWRWLNCWQFIGRIRRRVQRRANVLLIGSVIGSVIG